MAQSKSGGGSASGDDLVYGYLSEFIDGDLPAEIAARVAAAAKGMAIEPLAAQYKAMRGRLQLALQSYYLRDDEMAALRGYVQDPSVAATQERVRIEQLGRSEKVRMIRRRLIMVAAIAVVVAGISWRVWDKREHTFKPLEYLGYEAAMIEENATGRLNLPSQEMKEIDQYLTAYPGLDFKPRVLKTVPKPWHPVGATVIDYEIAKVATVVYGDPGSTEKLIYFCLGGALKDLPAAEPGVISGMAFQTYASDEYNIVTWEIAPQVLGILVGHRSAPELAKIALDGTRRD